jgi:hypothetical protein
MAGPAEPARLARARALHARAIAANSAARPAVAHALLGRALALLVGPDDRPLEELVRALPGEAVGLVVRILITDAKAEAELRSLDGGLQVLDQAARIADRHGDLSVTVSINNQRGLLLLRAGDMAGALAGFRDAESGFGDATALDRCNVLLNRGVVQLNQGDLAAARSDLTRCAKLAAEAQLDLLQAMAEHNVGYLEFLAGNIVQGLDAMQAAARPDAGIPMGVSLLDRARLLVEAGLIREADDVLAQAAAIFRRDRMAQDLAETELARAECALLAGELAEARRLAARARGRFRRRGNNRWRRAAELVLLQGDLAAGRPPSRLVAPALRLRAELAEDGLRLPARTAGLIAGEAYLASGEVAAAAAVVDELGTPDRGDPITGRLHTRYVRARLDVARGEPATAARQARAGLRELAEYQARFGSIDVQTASAIHGRRLAELSLSLAVRHGRAAGVLAAAEQARAVSTRLPLVRPPEDPQSAELLAELRRTVESLRGGMRDAQAAASLLRRRRELERAITARRWTLAGARGVRPTAGVAEVRAATSAADVAMVVFVAVDAALHAVVIDAGRLRLHQLGGSAEITELVRRVRADLDVLAQPRLAGGLRAAVRASFDRSASELAARLVTPLHVDGRRLVIVSTGILGQLPWGLLAPLRGVPIVVAPSATAWLTAELGSVRRRRPDVAAFAGPNLVRAEEEAAGVAAAWRSGALHVGADAARPVLTRALARADVVHVAAHGTHQTENPLFSSLRLADGVMFAHELDQAARTPQHVVLSACELGLATIRPGDEGLGLTSVLLRLGTHSVVAGVARVEDEVAARTMIAYHQRLAAGADSAAALAEATTALDGAAAAPFVCFGAAWSI